MKKPKRPIGRIIVEDTIGECNQCGSSVKRSFLGIKNYWIGRVIGCINPDCKNYYLDKTADMKVLKNNIKMTLGIPGDYEIKEK